MVNFRVWEYVVVKRACWWLIYTTISMLRDEWDKYTCSGINKEILWYEEVNLNDITRRATEQEIAEYFK